MVLCISHLISINIKNVSIRMVLCISPLSFKGGSWGKLQSEHSKPHWIKIDFDHFEVSDSEDENGVS